MPANEFSLGLLKPDCAERNLTEPILQMVRDIGLELVLVRTLHLTDADIKKFYQKIVHEDYFDEMSVFLRSGSVTAYVVKGQDAITRLNKLVGFNVPSLAEAGTIRSLGYDIRHNLAHSSENREDFLREASVIFSEAELIEIGAL